jgi:membrane protease YdiL (CAAX protease family)
MSKSRAIPSVLGVSLAMLAFCSLFFSLDQAYYRFIAPRFPNVGDSTWMATAFGVVSRAPWILLIIGAAVVRPRLLALRLGDSLKRWRLILLLLSVNLSLVGGYLLLSGGSTPYSGNQWLLTEVFTVPLVEELFWRGLVFSVLLRLLSGALQLRSRTALAVWLSGTAFGLLHAGNALAGVPLQFVAIQTLSAVLWGVMYGYARSQANSVYPPLLLHGAMNLLVVAF